MGELFKMSKISSQYGVSVRALTYYEELGLLTSTRGDGYAYRMYDETAINRLKQILVLRKLNISIKVIQQIFNIAGSKVVLEAHGKKIDAIDEKVSLLHEHKEVVTDFIRQVEQADFSNESDVKLLYTKAKKIENRLANMDYDWNTANENQLSEVTENLAATPDIVQKQSFCYLIFNLKDKKSVIEACELYCEAFGAEKTSEDTSASKWIDDWLGIQIKLFNFSIFMQSVDLPASRGGCCINFATEQDLHKAYDLLSKEAEVHELHTDAHWTPLCANITDKFGVQWFFCIS
ncbi:MAG: MerR family transcriptional regulator [Firmicutes bacterium]|nr:MerR family transcriptional regulator [Bacillota bacterium]